MLKALAQAVGGALLMAVFLISWTLVFSLVGR